jgi:hypothetical protein
MDAQSDGDGFAERRKMCIGFKKQDGAMARNPAWPLPSALAPHRQEGGTAAE